jgi:Flp pilus assembly protein CpaB
MKSRGLAVLLAFMLAVTATVAIFVYVQGVRRSATTRTANMVTVIVAKADVPAQTKLDSVITSGGFTTLQVPSDTVVQGAVTDLSQLKGQTTRYPILQGEQISVARFQGSTVQVKGGPLGIPEGYQALTLAFDTPQAVGGQLQAGDHVTIYAKFSDISIIGVNLQRVLAGKVSDTKKVDVGDMTIAVVPDVQILKVDVPTTAGGLNTNQGSQTLRITFALTPEDAENVIESNGQGNVWLALLPPNEKGLPQAPSNIVKLLEGLGRQAV